MTTLTLERPQSLGSGSPRMSAGFAGHLEAAGYAALAALAAVVVDRWVTAPNLSLIFVLPVIVAALRHGWGPALTAAVLGAAAYNFFLIEPRYTLRVADPANVWALSLLLAVAALVSGVATQARRRGVEATTSASRAEALQELAHALVAAEDAGAVAQAGAMTLGRTFGKPAVVLLVEGDRLTKVGATPGAALSVFDEEAARWALASRLPTRAGFYPIEEARYDFWAFAAPGRPGAVIGVVLADEDTGRPAAPGPFVTAVGDHLSLGLERQVLAARALEARVAAEGQRLKSDLLAAVSHDLRTPLSTILFTLQSLRRFGDRHDADTRDSLLAAAEGETSRLASLVANLLDMSRLSADAVTVELRPTLMAELVADAMAQAGPTLAGREVAHSSTGALLCVDADPALARTAVANVLENAAKYSPEGSPLELRLATDAETATLEVLDRGPGFPPDAEAMFGRFIRGVEGDGRPPGTGLGLSIARGFMEAQGGRVDASERLDGPGARVRLTFRLSAAPPA